MCEDPAHTTYTEQGEDLNFEPLTLAVSNPPTYYILYVLGYNTFCAKVNLHLKQHQTAQFYQQFQQFTGHAGWSSDYHSPRSRGELLLRI